ncbi:hypothetical protein [Mariniflexile sp. AS56]|nr:hypothetical protein [Mariniflexile sp. AS56]MDO7173862.1 hypothetical protein [Mariniflexile sp. AS56]
MKLNKDGDSKMSNLFNGSTLSNVDDIATSEVKLLELYENH